MAKVITFGNFKGGVGKTTASCMLSFILNQKGYKVLTVDFDPQANATSFLTTTFNVNLDNFTSLYEAIEKENLKLALLNLSNGFDLLPSAVDLVAFKNLLKKKTNGNEETEHYFLDFLLNDLKDNYDFIIIDVPPTISEFTNNALTASDYTLIIMQTEPDSLSGAIDFNQYANEMKKFNSNLETIGILPYLENKRSKVDEYILETSMSDSLNIRDLVFKNHIYQRERVKRFRINGITQDDFHDKKVFKMYNIVTNELLEKVGMKNE